MSHLACADNPESDKNREQLDLFQQMRKVFPTVPASLANSAGIFLGDQYHFDLVRPGAAIYGIKKATNASIPLQQVIELKAKILQIRSVDREATVGYGATASVSAGSLIATAAIGYADGLFRSLSNKAYGYAAGVKVPLVGRISMDLVTFDVTDLPMGVLTPGDDIYLLCEEQTVDDLAEAAGTIGYEILTSLGNRYERYYK